MANELNYIVVEKMFGSDTVEVYATYYDPSSGSISFKVNDGFDRVQIKNKIAITRWLLKIYPIIEEVFASYGFTAMTCSAYSADGDADYRASIYRRVGFCGDNNYLCKEIGPPQEDFERLKALLEEEGGRISEIIQREDYYNPSGGDGDGDGDGGDGEVVEVVEEFVEEFWFARPSRVWQTDEGDLIIEVGRTRYIYREVDLVFWGQDPGSVWGEHTAPPEIQDI